MAFPLAVGWSKVLSVHPRSNFNKATREDYSKILDTVQDQDITWQPYVRPEALSLDDYWRQQMVAKSRTVLICYEKAVYHRPDVAPKQFGYKSVVVADEMIDLKVQGRSGPKKSEGRHWGEQYSKYVSIWNRRALSGCLIVNQELEENAGGDTCQTEEQDQTVDKQPENLRNISSSYERDKKFWAAAITNLEEKIKVIKKQHFQLSREAHECASSDLDWTEMISAVQSLVSQCECEDLKVKYNEEHEKRRKLYDQVQEAKGMLSMSLEKVIKEQHFQLSSEAHECASSDPDWTEIISAVQCLVSQHEDLKVKYNEEHEKRSKLYDQVQEAKGMLSMSLEEVLKEQHFQLSREAHECASSDPDWTEIISAVQCLVSQREDLKVKYNEEHEKRRKLYDQNQEAKGKFSMSLDKVIKELEGMLGDLSFQN